MPGAPIVINESQLRWTMDIFLLQSNSSTAPLPHRCLGPTKAWELLLLPVNWQQWEIFGIDVWPVYHPSAMFVLSFPAPLLIVSFFLFFSLMMSPSPSFYFYNMYQLSTVNMSGIINKMCRAVKGVVPSWGDGCHQRWRPNFKLC